MRSPAGWARNGVVAIAGAVALLRTPIKKISTPDASLDAALDAT